MKAEPVSKYRRTQLVQSEVTWNGRKAKLSGSLNPYATLTVNGMSCEYSWPTVDHVVTNCGGKFK